MNTLTNVRVSAYDAPPEAETRTLVSVSRPHPNARFLSEKRIRMRLFRNCRDIFRRRGIFQLFLWCAGEFVGPTNTARRLHHDKERQD